MNIVGNSPGERDHDLHMIEFKIDLENISKTQTKPPFYTVLVLVAQIRLGSIALLRTA